MEQWIVFYQHIEPVHTLVLTDNKDDHAKYVEMQTAGHVDAKYVPLKVAEAAPDLLEALIAVKTTLDAFLPDAFATRSIVDDAIFKAKGL